MDTPPPLTLKKWVYDDNPDQLAFISLQLS